MDLYGLAWTFDCQYESVNGRQSEASEFGRRSEEKVDIVFKSGKCVLVDGRSVRISDSESQIKILNLSLSMQGRNQRSWACWWGQDAKTSQRSLRGGFTKENLEVVIGYIIAVVGRISHISVIIGHIAVVVWHIAASDRVHSNNKLSEQAHWTSSLNNRRTTSVIQCTMTSASRVDTKFIKVAGEVMSL